MSYLGKPTPMTVGDLRRILERKEIPDKLKITIWVDLENSEIERPLVTAGPLLSDGCNVGKCEHNKQVFLLTTYDP